MVVGPTFAALFIINVTVLLTMVPGLFVIFFVLGEFLVPHQARSVVRGSSGERGEGYLPGNLLLSGGLHSLWGVRRPPPEVLAYLKGFPVELHRPLGIAQLEVKVAQIAVAYRQVPGVLRAVRRPPPEEIGRAHV